MWKERVILNAIISPIRSVSEKTNPLMHIALDYALSHLIANP